MNLSQTIRRLSQQTSWNKLFVYQSSQFRLLKKLYALNGLEICMTAPACPEQYEIYRGEDRVGYYRLRHGEFTVEYPDCGGELLYEATPNGDGIFDEDERLIYLTKALRLILKRLEYN